MQEQLQRSIDQMLDIRHAGKYSEVHLIWSQVAIEILQKLKIKR